MKTGMKLVIVALFGMMFAMELGCGKAPAGNVNPPPGQLPNQPPGQPVCGEPTDEQMCVIVDYSRTLDEMIQAGKYDKVLYSEFLGEANFPIQRPSGGGPIVKVELILVGGYQSGMSGRLSNFIQYFDAHPELRYARIEEILALGEQYPDFQNNNFGGVVSLGSFFTAAPDGHHYLSYLGSQNDNGTKLRVFGGSYWEPVRETGLPWQGYGQFESSTIIPAVRK